MNGFFSPQSGRRLAAELAIMAAAALVLAALGPFGTWVMSLSHRLLIWALFAIGGYACFRPVLAGGDALASQSALPRWAAITVACLIAALPTTLIVTLMVLGPQWQETSAGDLAALYPQVLIVGATVTVVQLLVRRGMPAIEDNDRAPDNVEQVLKPVAQRIQASFLDQLPPHLGRDVLCIENEDHYIRVHTTGGNALILMRLRDAVAQLAEIDGAQVHRAWWVARSAVAEVARHDRRIWLKLVDGREVPVSRATVPMLRDKGWL